MAVIAKGRHSAGRKRQPALDGIRGICALGVVFTHVAFATFVKSSQDPDQHHSIWEILAAGQLSIGPFFIMSGLLLYRPFVRMTMNGAPRPALGVFFLRRAARLLPAFWLVVTVDLLLLNKDAINGVWDVLRPYTLMHIYDFHAYAGMDVLWTVPAEVQFYLLLPVLAAVMHWLARGVDDPAQKAKRMLVPLVLFILLEFGWTWYLHAKYELWTSQYYYPFGVAGLFAIGMALAIWSVVAETQPDRPPLLFRAGAARPGLFWIGALAFYAVNCAQPWGTPGTADWQTTPAALVRDACLLGFSFLIMVPLVVPGGTNKFMHALLANAPMRYLGRISYGIYLWHFSMMYFRFESGSVFGKTVPVQMLLGKYGFWELLVPVLLGTVAAASVSFFVLERPLIQLTERFVKRPPTRGETPTTQPSVNPAT